MDLDNINELLATVLSIAKVEQQLGYGKDTLRKKLNRMGYKFNKETKQYEMVEEVIPGQLPITIYYLRRFIFARYPLPSYNFLSIKIYPYKNT